MYSGVHRIAPGSPGGPSAPRESRRSVSWTGTPRRPVGLWYGSPARPAWVDIDRDPSGVSPTSNTVARRYRRPARPRSPPPTASGHSSRLSEQRSVVFDHDWVDDRLLDQHLTDERLRRTAIEVGDSVVSTSPLALRTRFGVIV